VDDSRILSVVVVVGTLFPVVVVVVGSVSVSSGTAATVSSSLKSRLFLVSV